MISGEMPKSADKIVFDLKPLKVGEGWYIVVTYPGGMQEHFPASIAWRKLKYGYRAKDARRGLKQGATQSEATRAQSRVFEWRLRELAKEPVDRQAPPRRVAANIAKLPERLRRQLPTSAGPRHF